MFIGREAELQKMNQRYERDSLEFIVIYGRRRVGKTALINEFVKDKPCIYFSALRANRKENLEAFSKSIYQFDHPDVQEAPVFSSFDSAFSEITRMVEKNRIVLVIDEFPYLAEADESISSRLQHLLDHDWGKTKIYLILCGSSMSYMEKEVLSGKSPLFGRRTAQLYLQPMDYLTSARFLPDASPEEKAIIYGITGGIPHYINKLGFAGSLQNALLDNLFDSSAYLFEEPQNLLKQELREPALYNSIISVIAAGNTKLSDISTKSGMDQSACLKYIKVLMELAIIKKVEPVVDRSAKKKEYRVADPFFRFWYRFVPQNMTAITTGTMSRIYHAAVESYLSGYMGATFEDICRQYLLLHMDQLPFPIHEIGEWWGTLPKEKKEAQIDIVATSIRENNVQDGRQYLIGSCKYLNDQVGVEEFALMKNYASAFTSIQDECYFYIFSKSGFTQKLHELEKNGEVHLISLSDIYQN
ncbi:MAG: ATP-binding protein [Clostridia bacterium]|nr:ATP-binding protein [Clostridia bacterium]